MNVTAAEVTAAVRTGDTGPRIGAFFDFDGTLVQGYTATSIYRDRIRHGNVGPLELARIIIAAVDGTLLGGDPQAIGRVGFASLRGRTADEVVQGYAAAATLAMLALRLAAAGNASAPATPRLAPEAFISG